MIKPTISTQLDRVIDTIIETRPALSDTETVNVVIASSFASTYGINNSDHNEIWKRVVSRRTPFSTPNAPQPQHSGGSFRSAFQRIFSGGSGGGSAPPPTATGGSGSGSSSGHGWFGQSWNAFTGGIGRGVSEFTGMARSVLTNAGLSGSRIRGFRQRYARNRQARRTAARRRTYQASRAQWWQRGQGPAARSATPTGGSWWQNWFGGGASSGRPSGGAPRGPGGGTPGGPGGPSWAVPGGPGWPVPTPSRPVNDWLTAMLMPHPKSTMGSFGGYAGANVGSAIGGAPGEFSGQMVGTVIGDFVSKMKDSVIQAHTFAKVLQENNRYLSNYNGQIAASYVQADVASMFRTMRLANEVAPSTIALNRQITQYEETTFHRSALRKNLQNETSGLFLGVQQQIANMTNPIEQNLMYAYKYISPSGDLGHRIGMGAVAMATTVAVRTAHAMLSSIPGIGPLLAGVANFIPGLKPGDPKPAAFEAGPWERLVMGGAAAIPASIEGLHNQRRLDPMRRKGRF